MSILNNNMASDLAGALTLTGQAVTYTGGDGVEVALEKVQFQEQLESPTRRSDKDGESVLRTAVAIVDASKIDTPASGDFVTANGEDWTVKTYSRIAGGSYLRITLTQSSPESRSRGGYRMQR